MNFYYLHLQWYFKQRFTWLTLYASIWSSLFIHSVLFLIMVLPNQPLARQINCCLLNFSTASIFKVLQCRSKLKMLSECQTAWIRMRRQVTCRLIRIQAVCIWDYSLAWQSKGKPVSYRTQSSICKQLGSV